MTISDFLLADLPQLPDLQPPDWGDLGPRFHYFVDSPHCSPLKITENNEIVAIGTTMRHFDSVWLACIIVHPNHRNKGLGKLITQTLIKLVDQKRFTTIYLDATEYGYPVYTKLGFTLETCYGHFVREGDSPIENISENIIPFTSEFSHQLFHVDREVSKEDRSGIISDFLHSAMVYVDNGRVLGYYIPGWGDSPIIALDNEAGIELMKMRFQTEEKSMLPEDNLLGIKTLEQHNYTQYRFSRRMYLGKAREWKADKIFNRISGQLG
ncbi:GNAT family N-acetyltransferase [Dyadobacter crusticola]|uniref:GNAT family N-acetyltransferase n=1 Tax=Dyadobacter crusticola TaxID=292407 RepID=UPI0004E0DDDA|nr:GNAT family N-acetyltransferase [Dyadobacter crusticola]